MKNKHILDKKRKMHKILGRMQSNILNICMCAAFTERNAYRHIVQVQMFRVTSLQDSRHDRLLLRCQPRLLWRTRPPRLGHGCLRGGEHRTGHQGLCVTQFPPLPAPFLPL